MKANELLDMIGSADDRIIEEAKKRKRPAMPVWTKWMAAVACFCLIAGAVFVMTRNRETPPRVTQDPPQITVTKEERGGMGFEGLMVYSAEELENGNPWREDAAPGTLPVFRNGSYDPSGAGVPLGLTEAEMKAELESAAKALELEIRETLVETGDGESGDGAVYSIRAITGKGNLTVYADGSLEYHLPGDYELPEEYHFTYSATSNAEAKAVMVYLTETYAPFLKFDRPEIVLRGDYTFSGDYIRRYLVYDSGTDIKERILNYNFRTAQFVPDESGKLVLIRMSDGLCKAEKLGDYSLISAAEAKEKLLNGQYQTSVPVAMPGEEYIAKTELVYRSGPSEEFLLPYYRFYVEIRDEAVRQTAQDDDLKTYGAYYVPAIRDGDISGLSTYNGSFN